MKTKLSLHTLIKKRTPTFLIRMCIAVLIIFLGALVRTVFFEDLGRGIPYLTFYPAVMLAAVVGGVSAGLLGTSIAGWLAFYWIQQGNMSQVESMAMGVFCISCTMISFICEAMIRAKAKAKKAQIAAEAANEAKSVFLANMSHELRTPLNAILGFSALLREDSLMPESFHRTLDTINRSGAHLLELINNVLDVAKIEAGKTSINNTAFNLHRLVTDVATLIEQRAKSKGLSLIFTIDDNVPAQIISDESKLRQILVNLVSNAVKFTQKGEITIRVKCKSTDTSTKCWIAVEVEDTGSGISPQDHERIFEPFVQLGANAEQKGSGLGLTISKQFAELMGGTLSLRSQPGIGTVFTLELYAESVKGAQTKIENSGPSIKHLSPGQEHFRILIVEDQEENWLLMQSIMETIGFTVKVATDGAKGVEVFQNWRPHFIWMDWRMPVMDGLTAMQTIRSMDGGKDVKIAVLTASVYNEDRDKVIVAGANDFVAKPLSINTVITCMERHLNVRFESLPTHR